MESAILGAAVDVELWPDRARVDDVAYSNNELADLLTMRLSADALLVAHETKKAFGGEVITLEEAQELETKRIT